MKQLATSFLLATFALMANAAPSLIGDWKSDLDLTMRFNRERARLEDNTVAFLERMMGLQTLTFTAKNLTTTMPDWETSTAIGPKSMAGFTETHPYTRLSSTRSEIAVRSQEPVTRRQRITLYHFEDANTLWVYLGGETFPDLHIREYYVRVRR